MLATGGADAVVNFFDVRTFKLEHSLKEQFTESISAIEFLSSRAIAVIADFKGEITGWHTR